MGSISSTWFWLIHVPFLGWGLLAIFGFFIWVAWMLVSDEMRR